VGGTSAASFWAFLEVADPGSGLEPSRLKPLPQDGNLLL